MHHLVAVTLPFFALVLCGHLAASRRVLPEAAVPGLNAYVLFFALPCLLFRFGASKPLANVSLLAERHGADNGRVARIIMASTVLAFGTFTLLAWLVGTPGAAAA
jgi:predicted permease